jgi:hypothetical protein
MRSKKKSARSLRQRNKERRTEPSQKINEAFSENFVCTTEPVYCDDSNNNDSDYEVEYEKKSKIAKKSLYRQSDEYHDCKIEASRKRYQNDKEYQKTKKQSNKVKYLQNEKHRSIIKQASKRNYHNNEEYRESKKQASKRKYLEDDEYHELRIKSTCVIKQIMENIRT